MNTPLLSNLPQQLHAGFEIYWQQLLEKHLAQLLEQAAAEKQKQFQALLIASEWAFEQCLKNPSWLKKLLNGEADSAPTKEALDDSLNAQLKEVDTEDDFYSALRQFRNYQQLSIIWRDCNRICLMPQTGRSISELADCLIQGALSWLYPRFVQKYGSPENYQGQAQQLLVIGMGKLGGGELNLSSDIDLIFAYASEGETNHATQAISHHQFFLRLGQALIKSLSQIKADGFVYRVDMRLRPFGASGPLVTTFNGLENYFLVHGREWERYAMLKARVITGSKEEREQLQDIITPFIYRRYLDFSAIDSMRDMKSLIQSEVRRKGLNNNVKLGAGGIRECEFIAQTFQLIKGGRDASLRERNLLLCYQRLLAAECLSADAVEQLTEAYCFLRNSEHLIQAFKDQQTQNLPSDELQQLRIALLMGFASYEEYCLALESHRKIVSTNFNDLVSDPKNEESSSIKIQAWQEFWNKTLEANNEDAKALFVANGFSESNFAEITELKLSKRYITLQIIGKERLDNFMPIFFAALAERQESEFLFQRLIPLIEAIMRRSNYLSLLMENQKAVNLLLDLCQSNDWMAKQFVATPALLDELLDEETFFSMADEPGLEAELRQQLLRIEPEDLEGQMETLRYFRLSHGLRVAAMEVTGKLPLMKVSDYLTWIAEALLSHVLNLAWLQMTDKHGFPTGDGGVFDQPRFIIVAYGKMGGLELGHSSDLDLVFIHDAPTRGETNGERSLDNAVFFTRLGQRIIHILNTRTVLGPLYEVDMRLRPSGASGLLVSSIDAFEKYQYEKAWTWEHQALVRARVVAGNSSLAKYFNKIRIEVLSQHRDPQQLAQQVIDMRNKMHDHLFKRSSPGMFPLKHSFGGIVDIEFMVQYAVLAWSHIHPELAEFTDNIRILQGLANTGLLPENDCQQLMAAYQYYRTLGHYKSLAGEENEVPEELVKSQSEHVKACWQLLLQDKTFAKE